MRVNIEITKRAFMMFMVAWITFISVFGAYQQTTEAADLAAGIVAAVGGAPLLTALVIGGVVVAGGVALYELSQTDAEDWRNFGNGIKQGFQEFVADREAIILKEQDSTLSDEEAATQGVAIARETVNGWWDSAVTGVTNTTKKITFNAQKYWSLYSKIIGQMADNNDNISGITPTTPIKIPIKDINGNITGYTSKVNLGANTFNYDGHYYINYGDFFTGYFENGEPDIKTKSLSENEVFFMIHNTNDNYVTYWTLNITSHTITRFMYHGLALLFTYNETNRDLIMNNNTFPIIEGKFTNNDWQNILINNPSILSVGSGSSGSSTLKNYEQTIKNTLDNTKAGKSISTGRKQLVNEGDYIYSAFKDNSIPIKKTSVSVQEGVATGEIGWDIPAAGTYDDVFSGGKPYSDVVGQTGTIAVPDDVIVGASDPDVPIDDDTSISFPQDSTVQDSSDYPKENTDDPTAENDKPQEVPDKPFPDILDEQGGTFYPTEMDLTTLFPFCIPFDIIYLVQKFDVQGEQAPVITIPIIYPQAIRSAMGSDRYEVVIDFQDYIAVRNVIRIFLLILFIAGLMKITRDLIRG